MLPRGARDMEGNREQVHSDGTGTREVVGRYTRGGLAAAAAVAVWDFLPEAWVFVVLAGEHLQASDQEEEYQNQPA
jgi:hypothetical protein